MLPLGILNMIEKECEKEVINQFLDITGGPYALVLFE